MLRVPNRPDGAAPSTATFLAAHPPATDAENEVVGLTLDVQMYKHRHPLHTRGAHHKHAETLPSTSIPDLFPAAQLGILSSALVPPTLSSHAGLVGRV